jgi:hypothetical protein
MRAEQFAIGVPSLRSMTSRGVRRPARSDSCPSRAGGIHRLWYVGGRWAYASALIDGFIDYIFITIDMANPTRLREVGRCWLPGMNVAAGEPSVAQFVAQASPASPHFVHEDTAYLAWRDAGLVILDVKDRAEPRLVAHKKWSPRALVRPPRKRPSFPVRSRDGGREQNGSRATFCGRTLHGRMLRDFSFVSLHPIRYSAHIRWMVQVDYVLVVE